MTATPGPSPADPETAASAPAPRPDPHPPDPHPPVPGNGGETALERRVKLVTSVAAPTTVLTALLFYYGYVATTAEYGWFGISLGSLRLSTQDLLLSSVAAVYLPLGLTLLLTLAGLWGHAWVRARLRTSRPETAVWRRAAVAVLLLGAAGLARGIAGVLLPEIARTEPIAATPLCLGGGVAAVAYGRYLLAATPPPRSRRAAPAGSAPPDGPAPPTGARRRPWTEPASLAVVAGLVVLSLCWAANSFAAAYGRGRAQLLAATLQQRPAVVLDTTDRLYLAYPGVEEAALPAGEGERFRYRYRGLRLLVESDGRLFLLPDRWDARTGAALVVATGSDVRVQFHRTG